MFLPARYGKLCGKPVSLCDAGVVWDTASDAYTEARAYDLCARADRGAVHCRTLTVTAAPDALDALALPCNRSEIENTPEAYVLSLGEESVIWASDRDGLVHAFAALEMLLDENECLSGCIADLPRCSFRGYRIFLPSVDGIDTFKDMVDRILVYYRYNRIILEIGGAMEYKRHPEINENWRRFCADLNEYSGKAQVVQHKTFPWPKNSIHKDNAEGGVLTQEEVRELVEYCSVRGIRAVPEVPCLSHADYIVQAYPELNERREDPYPDTYCPSNPKSYEILFDVMDEIIGVFHPDIMHIGHDEILSLGLCPECRKHDPRDLLLRDVQMIRGYLKERGIEVMMYGDKLIRLRDHDTVYPDCGGNENYTPGHPRYIPATYPLIDRMPEDLIIANWYWGIAEEYDPKFLARYRMMFANFNGLGIRGFSSRIDAGVFGASLSNWGSLRYDLMQRNCQLINLVFSSYLLWEPRYEDSEWDALFAASTDAVCSYYRRNVLDGAPALVVTHTTDVKQEKKAYVDGVYPDEEAEYLGDLVLTYADGNTASLPVRYGSSLVAESLTVKNSGSSLAQVIGSAKPVTKEGRTFYEWTVADPRPGELPRKTEFVARKAGIGYTLLGIRADTGMID